MLYIALDLATTVYVYIYIYTYISFAFLGFLLRDNKLYYIVVPHLSLVCLAL